jgi:hypothetical protein
MQRFASCSRQFESVLSAECNYGKQGNCVSRQLAKHITLTAATLEKLMQWNQLNGISVNGIIQFIVKMNGTRYFE